ncbi:binding-protein-dependent transport systems inner membrane component [Methanolacinia petrolearia DSM 11571]|uniref:Binding-protein-dependent transport systems inner membrane component n=1 Tax=Methanolacinia petrolearia (strain DSM 11571 / OCM 486 / SEBR 4847) TaxID=679926 RepID=E1RJK8_METP4|nr:nickel ABC transporter permease [Methanolacinia petrolearia]ADN35655.1 binding-protein-dependent transport systems inner membrane component [Methanolacinia petrolearia DSM 11571]
MLREYFIRRLLYMVPVLLFISFLSFSLIYIAPGDPAEIMMTSPGGGVNEEAVEAFRVAHGLDQPLYVQYFNWLGNAVTGDFGYSYMSEQPVFETVLNAFGNTLTLAVLGLIIALAIAIPAGILSAVKHNTIVDSICRFFALIGVSIPNFWQAYLMIVIFSVILHWLPASGFGHGTDISYMILPALVLGTSSAAVIMRMTRSSMLEVMGKDYITTARAKGLPEKTVITRHALKNSLIPVITVTGLTIGFLLNGSVIVETIFGWPGIGNLVVNSILSHDYMMVQGTILFVAIIYLAVNFVVDIVYVWANPEIRYERAS